MVNQREVTEDEGLEKNFATNTLGRIVFEDFDPPKKVLDVGA